MSCWSIIKNDDKVLLAYDGETNNYKYLPGGEVEFGESIYQAIEREINEELKVKPSKIKLLFANELFYYSKISEKNVHELCFYFLLDLNLNSEILQNKFYTIENNRKLFFEWVKINELEKINFKPGEIIKHIINPPNEFKIFNTNEKNQATRCLVFFIFTYHLQNHNN
ncbi:NUDIX hydrolase [Mycoplasmopsis cynos]|uniref:NUDIX hydrolase n=1 Tax=Mycoplasmopsis cynos TaxID=171284 RepID=UPI003A5C8042